MMMTMMMMNKCLYGFSIIHFIPFNIHHIFYFFSLLSFLLQTKIIFNFNCIFKIYNNIKLGIIERYSSLSALSGVELNTEILDYLFARLKRDLIEDKIEDKLELRIFIDALKSHFRELESMIKEIDEEFNS